MSESGANSGSTGDEARTTCPRGHWRPAEDEKLRQLVEQYGAQNWNSIAEKLQGRSGTNFDYLDSFSFNFTNHKIQGSLYFILF